MVEEQQPRVLAPPPSSQEIRQLAADCAIYSDNARWQLEIIAELFVEAHLKFPSGISLEIGVREGGTSLLFLRLIERMYVATTPRPLVVSCDPYGSKPYNDGHGKGLWENNPYSDHIYVTMKRLLAPFPNHVHFLLRGEDFLRAVKETDPLYWRYGEKKRFRDWTFAFLDGDHDATSILNEMILLEDLGCRRIVVDNADNDEKLWPLMREAFSTHDIISLASEGRENAIAIVDDQLFKTTVSQEKKDALEQKEDQTARVEEENQAGVRDEQ